MAPEPSSGRGPTLVVRALALADLDAWRALEARALARPWSEASVQDELTRADRAPRGAFVDDALAGVIALHLVPGADELWILNVFTDPARRRQGVARALVADAAALAAREARALWLEVRDDNVAARALYARVGFVEVSRRERYYPSELAGGAPRDAVVMRRDVARAG